MKTVLRFFFAVVLTFVISFQLLAQEVITDSKPVREVKSSTWELIDEAWRQDFQAINQAYKDGRKAGSPEKYDRYLMVINWRKEAPLTGQNHTLRINNVGKYILNTSWEKLIVPSYPIHGKMYFGHSQPGFPKTGFVDGYTVKDDSVVVQKEPIVKYSWRRTINGATEFVTRELYWVIRHRICQNPFNAIAVCDGPIQREIKSKPLMIKVTEIVNTINTVTNTQRVEETSQCRPQKTPMTMSSPWGGIKQAGQTKYRDNIKTTYVVINIAQSSSDPSKQCEGTPPTLDDGPIITPPPVTTGPNNQEHDPRVPGGGPWVF